jgi:V/A-type H+-transporting ATPase subunit I
MTIVALKKVSLCGLRAQKATVLEDLQALGCLHLVALRPPPSEVETSAPAHAEDATRALKYLLDTPSKRRPVLEDETFDLDAIVAQALANQQQGREASDRRDFLEHRIKELEPWGDFVLPGESEPGKSELAGFKLWFYILPLYQMKRMPRADWVWEVVHKDNRFAYVVVVAKQEPPAGALPVPRVHTGAVPLHQLRRQLYETEIELEELAAERQALTRWIFLLSRNLARAEDSAALGYATQQTLDRDGIFAVQGWLPAHQVDMLKTLADRQHLALLVEVPQPSDSPPTLLDNPEEVAGGQDLVAFYQTPGYRSWDPSSVLFFSFALFFAMILSDAGYGLLLGVLLLAYWTRIGKTAIGQRLRNLGAVLVVATLGWGVLTGGYFGLAPPEGSLLAGLKILDLRDFDTMMRLSVIIGVVHIGLANGIVAWQYRGRGLAFAKLGWLLAVSGGLMIWLASTGPSPNPALSGAGSWLVAIGLTGVFLFSSERSVRRPTDWLWRVLEGLKGLTGISQIFGDVLSYLRLFALGLASASLAMTFNQLAGQVQQAFPGIGFFLSLIILVLGHGLNLVLNIMSGVVHGLRLNFIEFYNWAQSEEGYPFKAFAKKESIVKAL